MKNVLTIEVDLWAPMPSEGAKGFPPPRPVEDRVGNLQKTLERWENLTRREKQIVRLVAKGFSTREIATRLDTSTGNVNTHVSHAMQKLGIHNRNGLRRLLEDWHL